MKKIKIIAALLLAKTMIRLGVDSLNEVSSSLNNNTLLSANVGRISIDCEDIIKRIDDVNSLLNKSDILLSKEDIF